MNTRTDPTPSVLDWDFDHLGDDEYDATLVKFPGWEKTRRLVSLKSYDLPELIYFEANFQTLERVDYPINDVRWPILSRKMLDGLQSVGHFPFNEIPVTMINDEVMSEDRYDENGSPKSGVENHQFVAIQLLERLEAFDWDRSEYELSEISADRVDWIENFVLKEPMEGFPPLFRLAAYPITLFVSAQARAALMDAGIHGLEFISLEDFRG